MSKLNDLIVKTPKSKGLDKLEAKAKEFQKNYTKTWYEYSKLQTQIRKTIRLPIDKEIKKLSERLFELKREKRSMCQMAYEKNEHLQELKQEHKKYWKLMSEAWQSYHSLYSRLIREKKLKKETE